jgi:type VI secretion system secreted protein VgrG
MILPRVSWEVSVAFFNGDPDQPFVLGRVYNAEKAPPYGLPGAKASGSLKSMSSPGAAGSNEIKMADSGGSQGFSVHAQKDLNITVLHDKTEKVGVDETRSVTVNVNSTVGADEKTQIGGSQSIDVGAVMSQNVGGNQAIEVSGNETSNATANFVEKVGGKRSYEVGGNQTVISNMVKNTIDGDISSSVGTASMAASIASITDQIGGNYSETVGAVKLDLTKGMHSESIGGDKNLTSTAAELHLVKGNFITVGDAAVTVLVGGLHYQKVAGDYSVKAPMIALIGAVGQFKGGGSELKLGGGPVVLTGSKVMIETALLVKLGSSLTMGS